MCIPFIHPSQLLQHLYLTIHVSRGIIINFDKTAWYKKFLFFTALFLIILVSILVFIMDTESDTLVKRFIR